MAVGKPIALGHITREEWRQARQAIGAYAKARKTFRECQRSQPKLLFGNDNKVGIAGEYEAMRYYQCVLRRHLVDRPARSNNTGYDFRYSSGTQPIAVSVKTVTRENKKGKTMPLKGDSWDELCVVLLDCNLKPYRIAVATQSDFEKAVDGKKVRRHEPVSRDWLEKGGWLHGKAKDWR